MEDLQISEMRTFARVIAPTANFDSVLTFYYDETNNIKKFYVRENDFNYTFTSNFVLGGLVHSGQAPDLQPLIDSFNLQRTVKEVKFKHIASGDFLNCLNSKKLTLFLQFLKDSDLFVHYSSLNLLYWSIVDIVDSAIVSSEGAQDLDPHFVTYLKNDLYKLARLEIDTVIKLFYKFEYPNIKQESVLTFIEELISLFDVYIDTPEYHFGLESLRQILEDAKKSNELPFVMGEEDHILLRDLSQFYFRPVYTFKYSNHIFDNEDDMVEEFKTYRILDGQEVISNYSFQDSQANVLIQLSDVFVGIIGKLTGYFNTSSREKIDTDLITLSAIQKDNITLLINLIDQSHHENIGFIHSTDSYLEMSKLDHIRNHIQNFTT